MIETSRRLHTNTFSLLAILARESLDVATNAEWCQTNIKVRDWTYREDNHYLGRTFHDDCKVEADFEALERLVYHNVLDLSSGYEGCGRTQKVIRGAGGSLYTQALQDEE